MLAHPWHTLKTDQANTPKVEITGSYSLNSTTKGTEIKRTVSKIWFSLTNTILLLKATVFQIEGNNDPKANEKNNAYNTRHFTFLPMLSCELCRSCSLEI